MDTTIEVVGAYPHDKKIPVHLIEILVQNSQGKFDLSAFTQEIPLQSKEYWQVPWDEKLLDEDGNNIIANDSLLSREKRLWVGKLRIIFFFHHLDLSKPLITPFGFVDLPKETPKPKRLSQIIYESPD